MIFVNLYTVKDEGVDVQELCFKHAVQVAVTGKWIGMNIENTDIVGSHRCPMCLDEEK